MVKKKIKIKKNLHNSENSKANHFISVSLFFAISISKFKKSKYYNLISLGLNHGRVLQKEFL